MNEPIYKQIENYLKALITENEMVEGDLLPSENQLCEKFNVSRMTVRAALNNLVAERYIEKKKGIGSVVTNNKIYDNIGKVSGFTKEMSSKGVALSTIVDELKVMEAGKKIASKLAVSAEEKVWKVTRVRLVDNVKVSCMTTYMPLKMFKDLNVEYCNGSLYSYIEDQCGYKINKSERIVEAILATKELKRLLDLEAETPILHIEQISRLDNGAIFEYSHTYHHNYKLTLNATSDFYSKV